MGACWWVFCGLQPLDYIYICYNSNYGTTWNYPNHTPGDSLRWLTKITKLVFPTSKFTHCKSPLSRRTPNNKGCCSYHQCLCDHIPWCFWFSWQPYWNILIAFWVSGKKGSGGFIDPCLRSRWDLVWMGVPNGSKGKKTLQFPKNWPNGENSRFFPALNCVKSACSDKTGALNCVKRVKLKIWYFEAFRHALTNNPTNYKGTYSSSGSWCSRVMPTPPSTAAKT